MKEKKQLVVLVVLLVVAGNIWYWFFFREKPVTSADVVSVAQNYQLLSVENPRIRNDEIEKARQAEYKSNGRNIFSAIPPPPPVVPTPAPKIDPNAPKPVVVPPPPTVPPLPVKFFGYGTVPNGTSRRAFFTNGDDVYIVPEGELLLNRFRILKIGNASLEYEEVSSGLRGTANIEEQGTSPSV